jgi:eukaryotic-like serine/threonine-protein kinase
MSLKTSTPRNFADRYELKAQAGTGGMGTVYQALDRETKQLVALKILHGKSMTDAARFDQEAALLSELVHPGIVRYVDHGVTALGESYIAMEWLAGETLEDRMLRGPLSPASVARLGRRVLDALAAAHERGIIHRDIKPSNIFLVDWRLDDVRLLDFGIARRVFDPKRFTKVGSTVGTPMYTAPEQARGDRDVDARADIFSLGCVLFEALTGEPPFTGESPMEVMAKICIGAPPKLAPRCPGLPAGLEQLVESMLTQDRRLRPGEAGKLALAFNTMARTLASAEDAGGGAASSTAPAGPPPRSTLSDTEQPVICALLVNVPATGAANANGNGNGSGRTPVSGVGLPRPPVSANSQTRVLTTVLAFKETREIERAIEPFGGQMDRLIDRSVLITLSARAMLPEQALQLARCALALQAQLPHATFALATGRATFLAKRPLGAVVDQVSALMAAGGTGVIHIDQSTSRLLPARFVFEGAPDRLLLLRESEVDPGPRKVGGRVGPFMGRDRELGTLLALYHEAVEEPVARVALVLAGSGAGKSRLRHELVKVLLNGDGDIDDAEAAQAGREPVVLQAAAELVRTSARYPLLGKLLEIAGIDTMGHVPAATIQMAWVSWLRARCAERPVILVLEDMQWADLASVQLVDAALRDLKDAPLFVIALGRPEVDDKFPSLWGERAVERLRLPPLGRRAGQTLVRHFVAGPTPEQEAFVLDRWEGNPLLLEELVTSALSGSTLVPETVLGLVEARFEELEPAVRRVLRACSVFGDDSFTPDAPVALLGEKSRRELGESLEILAGRDILQRAQNGGEVTFRFRHRLLREAAYRMLPPGDRALARRLARAFLENCGKTLPECLTVPLSQSSAVGAQG